jgi:hypothetical protein
MRACVLSWLADRVMLAASVYVCLLTFPALLRPKSADTVCTFLLRPQKSFQAACHACMLLYRAVGPVMCLTHHPSPSSIPTPLLLPLCWSLFLCFACSCLIKGQHGQVKPLRTLLLSHGIEVCIESMGYSYTAAHSLKQVQASVQPHTTQSAVSKGPQKAACTLPYTTAVRNITTRLHPYPLFQGQWGPMHITQTMKVSGAVSSMLLHQHRSHTVCDTSIHHSQLTLIGQKIACDPAPYPPARDTPHGLATHNSVECSPTAGGRRQVCCLLVLLVALHQHNCTTPSRKVLQYHSP